MKIVVGGALANKPGYGGEAWVRLSWIRGLQSLGVDVLFLEEIEAENCVGPQGSVCALEASQNLAYFRQVTAAWGLAGSAALINPTSGESVHGLGLQDVLEFAADADLLVNISGHLEFEPVLREVPWRVYVDLDPGFTQFWHAAGERGLQLEGHDVFFTVGENIGRPECPIPTSGIRWLPVRQPVTLDDWPSAPSVEPTRFTTVASWRGAYGGLAVGNRRYGAKAHEFRKFLPVPGLVPGCFFEAALDIHPADGADRERLLAHGWRLVNPRASAGDPVAFREYVRRSGAEFSVAQGIYVDTACGWFSDRSVRYLATGRPVLVQDTGFGRRLPVGEGLLSFRTPQEAAAEATRILGDYDRHRRAGRDIAEEFFEARKVLGDFLERAEFHRSGTRRRSAGPVKDDRRRGTVRIAAEKRGPLAPGPAGRLTVFVSGRVGAAAGQGGAAWAVLQYVLGLRRLGHEVFLVEPVPATALRPVGADLEGSLNAEYFQAVVERFGLQGRAALLLAGTQRTVGLPYHELRRSAARAALLVNLSGLLKEAPLLEPIPVRLYLDLDPGFTQLWQEVEGIDMGFSTHTHFASVGLALGAATCPVPTCGLNWIGTLQPVVLEEWPAPSRIERDAFTSVANWRSYGSIEHDGVFYGQKAHALRGLADLPKRAGARFALALAIDSEETEDLALLRRSGWGLVDPMEAAGTPGRYQSFVAGSRAEIGVAKAGYVEARCGWFSDRSACYLASGRPVVAQDTGFSAHLPTGEGLLAFASLEEAVAGVEEVTRDYTTHAAAARRLAEEHFGSDRVLGSLLARVGVA